MIIIINPTVLKKYLRRHYEHAKMTIINKRITLLTGNSLYLYFIVGEPSGGPHVEQ